MRTFSTRYVSGDKADRRQLFDGLSKIDLPGSQLTTKSLPAVIMPILISKRVSIDNNNDNGCVELEWPRKWIVRSVAATVAKSYRPCRRNHRPRPTFAINDRVISRLKNACNNAANFLHTLITPTKYAGRNAPRTARLCHDPGGKDSFGFFFFSLQIVGQKSVDGYYSHWLLRLAL